MRARLRRRQQCLISVWRQPDCTAGPHSTVREVAFGGSSIEAVTCSSDRLEPGGCNCVQGLLGVLDGLMTRIVGRVHPPYSRWAARLFGSAERRKCHCSDLSM
jgi:hypothetical protein